MKARILFLIVVLLATDLSASEARVLKNIETLLRNPTSQAARDAGAAVIEFAGESPDYHVELEVGYMPWVKDRDLPAGSQMLLAAFIAGNLREQIRKKTSKPEPYAGVLAALEVYEKLKRNDPGFQIAKADKFLAMERQGVLRAHIAAVK
jgi:hypothetical protein